MQTPVERDCTSTPPAPLSSEVTESSDLAGRWNSMLMANDPPDSQGSNYPLEYQVDPRQSLAEAVHWSQWWAMVGGQPTLEEAGGQQGRCPPLTATVHSAHKMTMTLGCHRWRGQVKEGMNHEGHGPPYLSASTWAGPGGMNSSGRTSFSLSSSSSSSSSARQPSP